MSTLACPIIFCHVILQLPRAAVLIYHLQFACFFEQKRSPSKPILQYSKINPPSVPEIPKFSDYLMGISGDDPTTSFPAQPIGRSPTTLRRRKNWSVNKNVNVEKSPVTENDKYGDVVCNECGSGDKDGELLLCDSCDKGYHMRCLHPILFGVPTSSWYCPTCSDHPPPVKNSDLNRRKILDFFRIQESCSSSAKRIFPTKGSRKRKRRTQWNQKRKRRLLPYTPSPDADRRLQQMKSLASALISLNLEYSDDLSYLSGMAPKSANLAELEHGGMQIISKKDMETLELCRAMSRRGECPPLHVVFDSLVGYTLHADGPIKDMTLIAEYTGDVDYIKNREQDDGDSIMTLLTATDPMKSLVICPDKRANIARFISGINNYKHESRKKKNIKCVRYNINGECRVLLVATRDIAEGERLYCDYNGCEHAYPTQNFV